MADIFVSYARKDRNFVEPFVDMLEAQGWSVWWDREIGPGSTFSKVIEQEIARARCLIVIWTSNSIESDWVNAEASEGLVRQILIPVKFEDVNVPLIFRQTQSSDLVGWPGSTKGSEVPDLLDAISAAINKPDGSGVLAPGGGKKTGPCHGHRQLGCFTRCIATRIRNTT